MRKRLLASVLAFTLALGTTVFARYDVEGYNYRKTTDLEASVEEGKVTVTWPAVNKSGELINANPLTSDSSYGNPTGGWTTPLTGMIIQYPNWQLDGTVKPNNGDKSGDNPIIMGLTDTPTEYPIVCLNARDSSVKIKDTYLSGEVVSPNYAPYYTIEYSLDGQNWILDHDMSTVDHGKKLSRYNELGEIVTDKQNTFFLEDQYVEQLVAPLEPETEYQIRVTATNSTKKETYKVFTTSVKTPEEVKLYPAFPTVEGGGTYSQGGRGSAEKPADVYIVTSLEDSVSDPQPGTFRYGLQRKDRADGNKLYPRIIVFNVSGVINIDPTASKSQRRFDIGSNTTILGHTAPDGNITIAGGSLKFDGDNIIVRYLRTNLGEGYDQDAATAKGTNIVVDHCSFMWGVDECFTAKEILNSSIQYNIIATSLGFPNKTGTNNTDAEILAGESEAKHGMGSILNGYETSYTHNLWANHGTRNPRFEGGFSYNSVTYNNKIDFANNVIYNWGHNSGYGGERGNGNTNFVGNYYKPGPNTIEKCYTRIFDVDGVKSKYYVKDNVMTSSDEVTADNTKGFHDGYTGTFLSTPVEMTIPYNNESAQAAYEHVLASAGASYVRNGQDARLIASVDSGISNAVNNEKEANGLDDEVFIKSNGILDADSDGIDDNWETAHGLDPADKTDAVKIVTDETKPYCGYTNIEYYAYDLLGEWSQTETVTGKNPVITFDGYTATGNTPDTAANFTVVPGGTYDLAFAIEDNGSGWATETGSSYSVYLNEKVIAQNTNSITIPDDTELGTYYLAVKAYGKNGNNTLSKGIKVIVVPNATENYEGFSSIDIGQTRIPGADVFKDGSLVSTGSGRIGRLNTTETQENDAFHFNYVTVKGDFSIKAKMNNLAKLDYMQNSGLMVRASLTDAKPEFYMASLTYVKGEDYEGINDVSGNSVKAKNICPLIRKEKDADANAVTTLKDESGNMVGGMLGIPQVREGVTPNIGFAKLERKGQTITMSGSLDGNTWYTLYSGETTLPEIAYLGFATDAAQDYMALDRLNATQFSEIELTADTSAKVAGDVNGNGTVNRADYTLAAKYFSGEKVEINTINTDVDANNIVNRADYTILAKYFAGYNVTLK